MISTVMVSHQSIFLTRSLQVDPMVVLVLLWRKSINSCVKVVPDLCNDRLRCFHLNIGDKSVFIVTVYMPYETCENHDLYTEYQGKLCSLVDGWDTSNILIMGDYNTDFNKDSGFSSMLKIWVAENELIVLDNSCSDQNSFTYFSEAHGSRSWLDHCVCSKSLASNVKSVDIL